MLSKASRPATSGAPRSLQIDNIDMSTNHSLPVSKSAFPFVFVSALLKRHQIIMFCGSAGKIDLGTHQLPLHYNNVQNLIMQLIWQFTRTHTQQLMSSEINAKQTRHLRNHFIATTSNRRRGRRPRQRRSFLHRLHHTHFFYRNWLRRPNLFVLYRDTSRLEIAS